MVLVQFRVTVSDVERFKATCDEYADKFEADGARSQTVWFSESDPALPGLEGVPA